MPSNNGSSTLPAARSCHECPLVVARPSSTCCSAVCVGQQRRHGFGEAQADHARCDLRVEERQTHAAANASPERGIDRSRRCRRASRRNRKSRGGSPPLRLRCRSARAPLPAPLAAAALAAAAALRCFASRDGARRLLERQDVARHRTRSPASRGVSAKCVRQARRVTSILPPSGASIRIRRAWRWSLRLIPPVRNASGAAIFGIADDRDGRSPPCARAAGACGRSAAAARPRRRGCRRGRSPATGSCAGSPCSSLTCIFSPPVPGCLASGASITPSSRVGHADDQRPIDLARGASREGLGEMPGRARASARPAARPTYPCRADGRAWAARARRQARRAAGRDAGASWSRPASQAPAAC